VPRRKGRWANTKLAVAKIVKGSRRLRSQMAAELRSHYLFADRFGRHWKYAGGSRV
jgi:hypothetical protein